MRILTVFDSVKVPLNFNSRKVEKAISLVKDPGSFYAIQLLSLNLRVKWIRKIACIGKDIC